MQDGAIQWQYLFFLINKELKALDSMQNLLLQDAPDSCSIDKNIYD